MTLVIEPSAETLTFYGPSKGKLSSTLTLRNLDRSKTMAVRLLTNVPRCISVKPKIALVRAEETVSIALKLKPYNLGSHDGALVVKVMSCALASFISYDLFDLMWNQAEAFRQIENRFIEVAHLQPPKMVTFASQVTVFSDGGDQSDEPDLPSQQQQQQEENVPSNGGVEGEDNLNQANDGADEEGVEQQNGWNGNSGANEPDNWAAEVNEANEGGLVLNEQEHAVGAQQVMLWKTTSVLALYFLSAFMVPRSRAKMSIIIIKTWSMRTIIREANGCLLQPPWSKTIKPKLRSIIYLTKRWHLMLLRINGMIKTVGAKMTMHCPLFMKSIHRTMVGVASKLPTSQTILMWKVSSSFKPPCQFSYVVSFAALECGVHPLTEAFFVIFVTLVLGILIGKTAV